MIDEGKNGGFVVAYHWAYSVKSYLQKIILENTYYVFVKAYAIQNERNLENGCCIVSYHEMPGRDIKGHQQ